MPRSLFVSSGLKTQGSPNCHAPRFPATPSSALWLKPEILQPIRSYKLRGVFNWAAGLSDAERAKGFSLWGTAARSLLPDRTPPAKIEAIERYGVTPVVMPFDELLDYIFHARWEEEPYSFLNPWADPLMIAGNGALALEICQDLPTVRTVYVPVGGGGLIAGIGSALKAHRPHVRVIAVQPEACPALQVSLAAGRPAWIEPQPTVCDTALPLVVDELFPLLSKVVDDVVAVSEEAIKQAAVLLAERNKLVVEAAGAMSVAAALQRPEEPAGTAVCILSGGSITLSRLQEWIAEQETGTS
jgi:threonine dehydratase